MNTSDGPPVLTEFQVRVQRVVRAIPRGRVLSYGAVAALAGKPRAARAVGAALSAPPGAPVLPWWRVVSASGRISTPQIHHVNSLQRRLLRDEGISVSEAGFLSMADHAWRPSDRTVARLRAETVAPRGANG